MWAIMEKEFQGAAQKHMVLRVMILTLSFYSVHLIKDIFTNHVFLKLLITADSKSPNLQKKFKVFVSSLDKV
jgi:hypothetical protein